MSQLARFEPPLRRVLVVDAGSRCLKLALVERCLGRLRILREQALDLQAEGLVSADEITAHLHTQDYLRVRIGIGKPPSKEHGAGHVLSKLPPKERELLDVAVQHAADAVELLLAEGVDAAQRVYNTPTLDPPHP